MAKKSLIIGIGSTGLSILEEAQQYHYEFTSQNKPGNNVEFIYLETDKSNKSRDTAGGKTEINPIFVDFGNDTNVDIAQLQQNSEIDSSWIPPIEYLEQGTIGAGGMPSFGRLALWKAVNFNNIRDEITRRFNNIQGDSDTMIYVVGSLTGGTGSGICLDLAYLLQDTLPQCRSNLQALLLLPNRATFAGHKALHENSFAALTALDFYSNPKNSYKIKWPDGSPEKEYKTPPFQLTQFISQDFSNGNASIDDLGELIKVAGMKVLMTILNTNTVNEGVFEDALAKRRIDQIGAGNLETYNSFGFKMIQYPKAQLKELLSINIGIDFIKSIVDPENFLNRLGNKKPILSQTQTFNRDSKVDFEEILKDTMDIFDSSNTADGLLISDDIDSVISQMISNKLEHGDKRETHAKFNTKNSSSYYALFNNNKTVFRNQLINKMYDYTNSITEKYKNLFITKLHIENIISYIDEMISFYKKRYGIDGNVQTWDQFIGIKIDELFDSKLDFQLTFYRRKYYRYIFEQLKEALKIQTIIPELEKLKENLTSEKSVQSLDGYTLPSLNYVNNLINDYKTLTVGDDVKMTLYRRKNLLEDSLEKYSTSFTMLFETGSMKSDIDYATDKYNRSESKIGINELFGGKSIMEFAQQKFDLMYRKCIDNSVGYINEQDFFTSSLIEIIDKIDPKANNETNALTSLFNSTDNNIREKVPAMFGLNTDYSLGKDAASKLIITTSDSNKYNKLFTQYEINRVKDNAVDLIGLTDVIVIYQEYATTTDNKSKLLNPIQHINTMPLVKKHIKERLASDDSYFIKKSPYLSKAQLKKILN